MYCSAFPDEVEKAALHVTSVGSLVVLCGCYSLLSMSCISLSWLELISSWQVVELWCVMWCIRRGFVSCAVGGALSGNGASESGVSRGQQLGGIDK
jgi:hypothetical protein